MPCKPAPSQFKNYLNFCCYHSDMKSYLACDTPLRLKDRTYCSNKCQGDYQYTQWLDRWKAGLVDGGVGIQARNVSGHLRRYLFSKYGAGCTICGWNKVNPVTQRIPLEIDHIDGNSENNIEANLRILCPNCHSLTPSYRNLNKGNGRVWRKVKYIKVDK
jgi:hypothetical protein